jgi:hypothetical protein
MTTSFVGSGVNVFYVDGESGNDSNGGTGPLAANAWKTIQKAADGISSSSNPLDGDEVRIMKTSNDSLYYRSTSSINLTWSSKEVTVTGANSSGVVDGTVVKISGASLDASTPIATINGSGGNDSCSISCLEFDGAGVAEHGVEATSANSHQMTWANCRFTNCTTDGLFTNDLANYWNIINCRFDNNDEVGFHHEGSHYAMVYKCLFDNNGSEGARMGGVARVAECVFYHNGSDGLYINSMNTVVCDCVFDSNVGHGVNIPSSSTNSTSRFMNNVCSGNTGAALRVSSNNCETNWWNTVMTDNAGGTLDDGTQSANHTILHNTTETGSVNFRSPANLDFTPTSTSNVIGAGWPTWYKEYGSTGGYVGITKWVNTESNSIF